ncbi:MAG: proline iminopeptidase-family hydrolase [Chloroflexota bacterium]|nr:proline iminopeptidase-family hydrolase [Chloroflexota bacterium]
MPPTREGNLEVPGGKVWYQTIGQGGIPLLCLHGGPGMAHDYIDPLGDLADERMVVFYDQLGCGRSERPNDPSLWTLERSVAEVAAVREALGLDRMHLFGNSWGGWLATQYTLDRKPSLESLTISSSPPSVERAVREMNVLRSRLPAEVQAVLDDHEARGVFDTPEYAAATMVFYKRHLCRTDPWPPNVEYSMGPGFGSGPYLTMWGPSEFGPVTGNLDGWDITDRLGEIRVPTLLTVGRHDEMWPSHMADMQAGIAGSDLVVFEESSHMAFVEEREAYIATVRDFLHRAEAA